MKKIISFLILFISIGILAFGQKNESEIALKEYFLDAEFFLAQEFYKDALNDFIQVYRRGYEDNANVNYKIGICYLNIPGQKDKAVDYLAKASNSVSTKYKESSLNEKNAPIDVFLYLGNAYRVTNRLDEAIASYNKYKELAPKNEPDLLSYANQQIEACNLANEFMSNPDTVVFENLGEVINTSTNQYKPVISGDGSTIAFMHGLPFYDAVYVSKKENGSWSKPENITPQILSDGDQFVTCISYDGTVLYLTREDEFNSDIYRSEYIDGRWGPSQVIGSNVNTKYWESHAAISDDGNTLYFTSNRKGTIGAMDIYVSTRMDDGFWGPAKNLGAGINTELNEDTPFITADGKMLFFSSQGFTSMGGYDVFVSELQESGEWSIPKNLEFPLNTTDDDLFYNPWGDGSVGYMARIMEDTYGEMDIYKVTLVSRVKEMVPEVVEEPIAVAPVPVEEPDTVKKPESVEEPVPEVEVVVVPVVTPEKVVTFEVTPLLFGFDKYSLTEQGKRQLDNLVKLLDDFQGLSVILVGYTDALGPENYNLRLSKQRAISVMQYIISKGIEATRLKATGKGETNFIAPNTKPDGSDNPDGRSYNRRVEIEITGADQKKLMIKAIDPVPKNIQIQHQK
jgi:outer membrane protein OmpA-like peptidoglycan-associated protein/tetratricopeptide (TPR) repeat protein